MSDDEYLNVDIETEDGAPEATAVLLEKVATTLRQSPNGCRYDLTLGLDEVTTGDGTGKPFEHDTVEIDTADPAEWPADPEQWPRDLVVRDIDEGGEAVYTRTLTSASDGGDADE